MQPLPKVAIGMPVYNGGDKLREAMDCLLDQSFDSFSLIISDNASTDATADICRDYAARDTRIRYIRQTENIGAEANFRYVYQSAPETDYFMWAAADDTRSKDFLDLNLSFLENNPDYLASTCPVRFHGRDFDEICMGDASLDHDNPWRRVTDIFRHWHANGRFYSLFRRDALCVWANSDTNYFGSDWALITRVATAGKLNRLPDGWVELGVRGASNTTDIFSHYRRSAFDWLFPLRNLSIDTWRLIGNADVTDKFLIGSHLLRLNLHALIMQFRVMARRRSRGEK